MHGSQHSYTVHLEIFLVGLIWHYSCHNDTQERYFFAKYSAENYISKTKTFIKINTVPSEIIVFKGLKAPQTSTLRSREKLALLIRQCPYCIHNFIRSFNNSLFTACGCMIMPHGILNL